MITTLVQLLFPYDKERDLRAGRMVLGLQNDLDLVFDWIFFSDTLWHEGGYILNNATCHQNCSSWRLAYGPIIPFEWTEWPEWHDYPTYYHCEGCTRCDKECDLKQYERVLKALFIFCVFGTISWLMLATDGRFLAFILRIVGVPQFSTAHMLGFAILFEDIPQIVLSSFIDAKYRDGLTPFGIVNIMTSVYSIIGRIAEGIDFWQEKYESGLGYEKEYKHGRVCVSSVEQVDEMRFLTGCSDCKIRLWNADAEKKYSRLYEGHSGRVNTLAIIGSNRFLSGSSDSTAKLWHLEPPPEAEERTCLIRTFNGHRRAVTSIATIDDVKFVSGSHDKTAKLWNVDSGECLRTFDLADRIVSVAKVSDSTFLTMAVSSDQCARLWSVDDESESITAFGRKARSANLCWPGWCGIPGQVPVGSAVALDKKSFVVGSGYGWTLWELDLQTKKCIALQSFWQRAGNNMPKSYIIFWPLVMALKIVDGIVFLKWFRSLSDQITSMAIVDQDTIVTVSGNGTVRVLNVWTGMLIHRFSGGIVPKTSVVPLEAHKFVTGSLDGTAKLWTSQLHDNESPSQWIKRFRHEGRVMAIKQVDHRRFLTGCADNRARLWDANTGQCEVTYDGHNGFVCAIAIIFPGGRRLLPSDAHRFLTGSSDSTIMLWDIESQTEGSDEGRRVRTYSGHNGTVTSIACINDDAFVSGSHDKTARLWNVNSGACSKIFEHGEKMKDRVVSVAKAGESAFVSTSVDQCLRIWDIEDDATPTVEEVGDKWFSPFLSLNSFSDSLLLGSLSSLNERSFLVGRRNGAELWRLDANEGWRCMKIFMPLPLNFHLGDKIFMFLGVLATLAYQIYWLLSVSSDQSKIRLEGDLIIAITVTPFAITVYLGFCAYSFSALGSDNVTNFVTMGILMLPLVGTTQSFALLWHPCQWYFTMICAVIEDTYTLYYGAEIVIFCCDIIAAVLLLLLQYIWISSKIGSMWKKLIVAAVVVTATAASFVPAVSFSSFDVLAGSYLAFNAWYYFDWYSKSLVGITGTILISSLLAASYAPPWPQGIVTFTPFDVLVSTQFIGFVYFWTEKIKKKWVGALIISIIILALFVFHWCSSILFNEWQKNYYHGLSFLFFFEPTQAKRFKVSSLPTFTLGMALMALHWFFVSSRWHDWVTAVSMPDESTLLTVSRSGCVRIWNVNDGKCVHQIFGEQIPMTSIDSSCDGFGAYWFFIGSWDHTARVSRWDGSNGENTTFQTARHLLTSADSQPQVVHPNI